MTAAIRRYLETGKAALPMSAQLHMVAARYGQSIDEVREWAFDDLQDAMTYMPITKPPTVVIR